ncbi:MAG: hypothetical protein ACFFBD_23130 [Candidatus Hodarchaeota archaeon]
MVVVEVTHSLAWQTVSTKLIENAIECVLKSVLPEEDFSVIVNHKDCNTITVSWKSVG